MQAVWPGEMPFVTDRHEIESLRRARDQAEAAHLAQSKFLDTTGYGVDNS